MGDFIAMCVLTLLALFGGFILVVLLVYTPYSLYADMKCAEQGFPKAKVTINLVAYCMNLDGSVTVKMEKLGAKQ